MHQAPRPLLYAGALAEGIMETKTNSLSSQPPQNRNTPIIKERGAARASGWRERGKKLGSGGNAENQLCEYSLGGINNYTNRAHHKSHQPSVIGEGAFIIKTNNKKKQ